MAPSAPTLSVLIAVRDGGRVIADQLKALASQEFRGTWEVIVADNGSRDDTVAAIESFAGRVPCLRVVDASAQLGQAYALNEGARAARGRSILLLDADDVVAPGYLTAMATALERSAFVAARLDCESLNPPWSRWNIPPQIDRIDTALGFLPAAAGCSLGIRRSVLVEVGGLDPSIPVSHDIDLCWRVQLAGYALDFAPDAVVGYRYRQTLWDIFVQARGYGVGVTALYSRHRARGMPRRSWRTAMRFHGGALVKLSRARCRSDMAACAYLIGFRYGLIIGVRLPWSDARPPLISAT